MMANLPLEQYSFLMHYLKMFMIILCEKQHLVLRLKHYLKMQKYKNINQHGFLFVLNPYLQNFRHQKKIP